MKLTKTQAEAKGWAMLRYDGALNEIAGLIAAAIGEAQGGFAPEVVRVPFFDLDAVERCGHLVGNATYSPVGGEEWARLTRTVAARSNALPGWLAELRRAIDLLEAGSSLRPLVPVETQVAVTALRNLVRAMLAPEMGEGPA